jgi:hypothetical protein
MRPPEFKLLSPMVIDVYNRKEAIKEQRLKKIRRKQARILLETIERSHTESRRGLAALVNPIPSQYAQQGVPYSYQFPSNTFSGTGLTYTASVNRPVLGRDLPSWLSFNPATRTFSGTPTEWWELETLQIVVEADEAGQKAYCIFLLTVGSSENVGRPCWRAGTTPDLVITSSNIGSVTAAQVNPGDWVVIDQDLTKDPLLQSTKDKLNLLRAAGAWFVWKWNNVNGLYAHRANRFDFDFVQPGETIAVDFSAGNTRAFNPDGKLWRGLRGKEIYVTNYGPTGTILARNSADNLVVSGIRFTRQEGQTDEGKQDCHIRVVGQPANHVPFVNMYGIKFDEGIAFQVDGCNGYIESAYIEMGKVVLGWHWKSNTTSTRGDRRPSENLNGWNDNQYYFQIHDCFSKECKNEAVYMGGGGFEGIDVKVNHNNADGTPKMILVNGQSVQEYHNIWRYGATIEYARIEHCIFLQSGWDAIQFRCVTKEMRCMYNYVFQTGRGPDTNNVQTEGIMADSALGEVAHNYVEAAYFSGIRCSMIGLDNIHHNIIVDTGQSNWGNPNLNAPQAGWSIYAQNRGTVVQDIPQFHIAEYPTWSAGTTYNIDNQVQKVKVKYNGKSYRSMQAGNTNHNPETSPTWWQDTREWVSHVARPDLTQADLYFKVYNNTCVNSKYGTINVGVPIPGAQRYVKNNLFVNCNSTIVSGGSGSNTSNNIAVTGATLTTYFVDPVNKDFRLKAGSPAIGAGVNLAAELTGIEAFHDGFLDYSGQAHAATPSVGAFENGAPVGDHYSFVVNGQATGGTTTPPPITLNAGPDLSFNLPINSTVITAVPSDGRTLTTTWSQISGPNAATILNGNTLTATFADLTQGTYTFQVTTVDEHGQSVSDQVTVTVNPAGIVTQSTFQWYIADDNGANAPNLATKAAIPGANAVTYNPAAYVGQGKWFARGERPVAKTGVLIGEEVLSNWIKVA